MIKYPNFYVLHILLCIMLGELLTVCAAGPLVCGNMLLLRARHSQSKRTSWQSQQWYQVCM